MALPCQQHIAIVVSDLALLRIRQGEYPNAAKLFDLVLQMLESGGWSLGLSSVAGAALVDSPLYKEMQKGDSSVTEFSFWFLLCKLENQVGGKGGR